MVIDTKKGEQILSVSPIEYIGREIFMKRMNPLMAAALLMLSLTGCTDSVNTIKDDNREVIKYSEAAATSQEDDNVTVETYQDEIKSVYEENKKETFTEIECENVKYKIKNVEISKNIGNHEKSRINFWNEQIDEQGNLLGNEQYIWITFKVKNSGNEKQEILLNNLIANIDSENTVTETAAEARYIYPEQSGMSVEHRFHCILEPDEEKEVEIGYIIEEKDVQDAIYYCLGSGGGSSLDNPSNIFIYLGELEDEK